MRYLLRFLTTLSLMTFSSLTWAQSLSNDERSLVDRVNAERAIAGLHELIPSVQISEIARAHSNDMVANRYFSHNSPSTGDLGSRLRASGVPYRRAGENIAFDYSVGGAHQAFMTSPHHRENVLDPSATHVGIGAVQAGQRIMVTQVFLDLQEGATLDEAPLDELLASLPADRETQALTQPWPGLAAPPSALDVYPPAPEPGAGLDVYPPVSEPGVHPDPEPPFVPEAARPHIANVIPQPWFDAAMQGFQAFLNPIQPRPLPVPQPPQVAPPAPEVILPPTPGQSTDLTPGIWIIDQDGTRHRIELDPDTVRRLLSAF